MILNKYKKQILFFYLLIFILFSSLKTFAQVDTVYVDEGDKYISKDVFQKKGESYIYRGVRYATDTLVLNKLYKNCFFGKLTPTVNNQLFKQLSNRYKIDTTKILIIHYNDSLKSSSHYIKKGHINNIVSFCHEHLNTYKGFLFAHKKCRLINKKYKKTAKVLHFYKINYGHPEAYKDFKWYKDYGSLIKKIFLDDYKYFVEIIIHPDGEFYSGYSSKFPYANLIIKKEWEKYKSEFEKKLEILNQYK